MMRNFALHSLFALSAVFCLGNPGWSQELFREAFDTSGSMNNWGVNATDTDYNVIFGYTYGSFENVPEAPNTRPSDAEATGLILEANINSPGNLVAYSLYPLGQSFSGNYQLRFDAWMNYDVNEAVNGAAVGTTEFIGGGVGYDNVKADVGSGAQAIVTGDGGSGSDWRVFKETETDAAFYVAAADMAAGSRNNTTPYYADFLPGAVPPAGQSQGAFIEGAAGVPAFQWITWEFTAINNVVDITIEKPNGERLPIATLDGNDTSDGSTGFNTDGNISLFYADFFTSVSPQPALTFGLIDNVVVTTVVDTGLDGDYNDDDVVNLADYTVWRDNLGAPAGTLANDPNNGPIGSAQYDTWKTNFGTAAAAGVGLSTAAVPEPSAIALTVAGVALVLAAGRRSV